jgi:hypothetical protein
MPQSAPIPGVDMGYAKLANVTPNDVTPIGPCKSIYVGGTGNLAVIMPGAITFSFAAVPAGTWLPICPTQVKATGTTATGIVRMY